LTDQVILISVPVWNESDEWSGREQVEENVGDRVQEKRVKEMR